MSLVPLGTRLRRDEFSFFSPFIDDGGYIALVTELTRFSKPA